MSHDGDRHSFPEGGEEEPELTPTEVAHRETINSLRLIDHVTGLVAEPVAGKPLRPSSVLAMNRIALDQVTPEAGRWRVRQVFIDGTDHIPPPWPRVAELVEDMCDYVCDEWETQSAMHLSAYVMWRLNWIHPFIDGNGRTSRAVSYFVLCARLGFALPGTTTVPELIAANKQAYYEALDAADAAWVEGRLDVSQMEELLGNYLAKQLHGVYERATT